MTAQPSGFSRNEGCRMDIDSPWEREYWAKHFHVSEHEIARIVQTVGPNTESVARYIRSAGNSASATTPAPHPPSKPVNKSARVRRAAMSRLELDPWAGDDDDD